MEQGTEPSLFGAIPQKAQAGGSQEHVLLPKAQLQEYAGKQLLCSVTAALEQRQRLN